MTGGILENEWERRSLALFKAYWCMKTFRRFRTYVDIVFQAGIPDSLSQSGIGAGLREFVAAAFLSAPSKKSHSAQARAWGQNWTLELQAVATNSLTILTLLSEVASFTQLKSTPTARADKWTMWVTACDDYLKLRHVWMMRHVARW